MKRLWAKVTAGDQRSVKAKKNILVTFGLKGGSMLVTLALVPLTINYVSASEYGIWLTLSSLIAWFSLFDIGFGHGLRNKFAEAVAQGQNDLAKIYVSTTYAVLILLVTCLWLIFFVVNHFLNWSVILNVDEAMQNELGKVALIVFTFFSLQFILKLLGTVLTANQEPSKAAGFDFIANLFILVTIFLLIKLNPAGSLETLAWITGGFQVLVLGIATCWFYTHELKQYKPSVKDINFDYIRPLMGLGVNFFIIQISMVFVFQSTNIIITQLLGPEQVTVYNIAYRYFTIPMTVAMIIASPLWSAFTDAYVKKDYKWMQNVYKKLIKLSLIIGGILIMFFFFSSLAYNIWIGDKVIIPRMISLLMMLTITASTITSLFIVIINGVGKLRLQIIVNIMLSIIYIPLAILGGKLYGLNGIVLSVLVVNSVYTILVPIQAKLIVNDKASGIWNK